MESFDRPEIQELPLGSPLFRRKVEEFLEANGLRLDSGLQSYFCMMAEDGNILGGAALEGDVIKCVAVSPEARSMGIAIPLISHVISEAAARGVLNLKVFTKPANEPVFGSLGFRTLASAPDAVLMENGSGLENYCAELCGLRRLGRSGVVVMNANPFTLGHEYLLRQAARQVDTLFVIPVSEDRSAFPYAERLEMMRRGAPEGVVVLDGSAYQISAATFPTYFLKDLSAAAENQMRLDIDLFCRHIAPALGASVRFAGSEPSDPLTARYNALMAQMLPSSGLEFVEIPRLEGSGGVVTATRVRALLAEGCYGDAASLVPAGTRPYLLAALAERALLLELDAPLKPGLVCPGSRGSHADMDYAIMRRAISALRPFWVPMVLAASPSALRHLGLAAESAMLAATGGINTHKGAIFSLGITLSAAWECSGEQNTPDMFPNLLFSALLGTAKALFVPEPALFRPYEHEHKPIPAQAEALTETHGQIAVCKYGVKGAKQMALEGYQDLFAVWLPYYKEIKHEPFAIQRLLVLIASTLDDTCMIHRVGYARSLQIKDQLAEIFGTIADSKEYDHIEKTLTDLCNSFAAEGASPGGAADMLALTIFIDSLITNH